MYNHYLDFEIDLRSAHSHNARVSHSCIYLTSPRIQSMDHGIRHGIRESAAPPGLYLGQISDETGSFGLSTGSVLHSAEARVHKFIPPNPGFTSRKFPARPRVQRFTQASSPRDPGFTGCGMPFGVQLHISGGGEGATLLIRANSIREQSRNYKPGVSRGRN